MLFPANSWIAYEALLFPATATATPDVVAHHDRHSSSPLPLYETLFHFGVPAFPGVAQQLCCGINVRARLVLKSFASQIVVSWLCELERVASIRPRPRCRGAHLVVFPRQHSSYASFISPEFREEVLLGPPGPAFVWVGQRGFPRRWLSPVPEMQPMLRSSASARTFASPRRATTASFLGTLQCLGAST